MNLKVVSREVWKLARVDHSWLPEAPAPNTRYPVAEWSPRIGRLMPSGQDHWWWLRRASSWDRWLLRSSELSRTMACQPSSAPSGKHHKSIAGRAVHMELQSLNGQGLRLRWFGFEADPGLA